MKIIILIVAAIIFSLKTKAQQHFDIQGLDKFAGRWQYFNGLDTIRLKCVARYVGNAVIQVKGIQLYYTYKQGNIIIWDNFSNSNDDNRSDFGGTRPTGPNLDSLEVGGKDKLKRKTDEGYLIINTAGDQLSFVRVIGISGGSLSHSAPGEGPLPGYTLPATIVFTKMVYTESKGVSSK